MYRSLKCSGFRRSITAIVSTAAIAIIAGCDASSSSSADKRPLGPASQPAAEKPTYEFLPGPDVVRSDFLSSPIGQGHDLRAEYPLNLGFSGTLELDRTDPYVAISGDLFLFNVFVAGSSHFPEQPRSLNGPIRWTCQVTAPVAGSYELVVTTSGTNQIFIDGDLVFSTNALAEEGDVGDDHRADRL